MIPFENIDARLEALGKDRVWLAEKSGRKLSSIRVSLAPNAEAKNRSEMMQRALSEVIEREEASRVDHPALPSRLAVEANSEEFSAWARAFKASPYDTFEAWAIAELNAAARAWKESSEAPANVIAGDFWLDLCGGIAAGDQISSDAQHEPVRVSRAYDDDCYALRVFGRSMEPKIPDGSLIAVQRLAPGTFPAKGSIVVYSDAYGLSLKKLGYRKAKGDEEGNAFGQVPVLSSLNPAFRDVQTIDGGKIEAVFVEVL